LLSFSSGVIAASLAISSYWWRVRFTQRQAMLSDTQQLRFECTQCGQCCIAGPGHYVFLTDHEAGVIRDYLGLSEGWFRRRYLRRLSDGDLVAVSEADGRCVFLGTNGQCRVYAVRPVQCRTYPFWPEVLCSGAAWEQESRRCEGIGRGAVVPVTRIRAALARQRAHDAGLG